MIELADFDKEKYEIDDFVECITNKNKVLPMIKDPKFKFKGPGGHQMAAIVIQKSWRGYKSSHNFRQLKFLMKKATIIQRKYRLYSLKSKTGKKMKDLRNEQMRLWTIMQDEFKSQWSFIKNQKRIEIHLNSFSMAERKRMTMEKLK